MNSPTDQSEDPDQERLDALGRKIEAARGPTTKSTPAQSGSIRIAYRLASELLAGLLLGVFLGWGFDKLFGTRPWGILFFLILGLAAAMTNVIRTAQRLNAAVPETKDDKTDD
ncbi:MAG: AtpZ/AtpI family protein [Alphaproteobacteria bacterium]|nr:AtpZ/AtpI family protein [Alphaproteobacteria bacterium]